MLAIESGSSPKQITQLINESEDVNEVYSDMCRAVKPVLRYALDRISDKDSIEIIKILIDAGANVNAITYNRVTEKNLYGMMPLISYAAIYSLPEVVQILIDHGADVNYSLSESPIDSNKTALTYAQELDKKEVIEILQKAGAF